jgi:hypothetical protein
MLSGVEIFWRFIEILSAGEAGSSQIFTAAMFRKLLMTT